MMANQHRLEAKSLARKHSILALLFRLELETKPHVLSRLAVAVLAWLRDSKHTSMRRDLSAWFASIHRRRWGLSVSVEDEMPNDVEELPTFYEIFTKYGEKRGRRLGRLEGKAEGRAEGLLLGLRESLKKILTQRFGSAPQLAARIDHASQAELEQWLACAVSAPDLPSVFESAAQQPAATPNPAC